MSRYPEHNPPWQNELAVAWLKKNKPPGEQGIKFLDRAVFERLQFVPGRCNECLESDKPGAHVQLVVAQRKGTGYQRIGYETFFFCDECVHYRTQRFQRTPALKARQHLAMEIRRSYILGYRFFTLADYEEEKRG